MMTVTTGSSTRVKPDRRRMSRMGTSEVLRPLAAGPPSADAGGRDAPLKHQCALSGNNGGVIQLLVRHRRRLGNEFRPDRCGLVRRGQAPAGLTTTVL